MIEKVTRRDAILGAGAGLLAATSPTRSALAQQKVAAPGPASRMALPSPNQFRPGDEARERRAHARGLSPAPWRSSRISWAGRLVNMTNRRGAITQAPEPGLPASYRPRRADASPCSRTTSRLRSISSCPNQDVVYGLGFFALDVEPVVIQVPDFGDRFWVYALYDARTDQFGHLGKPYATKQDSDSTPCVSLSSRARALPG
jgi:uncharacterized protein DUF1254